MNSEEAQNLLHVIIFVIMTIGMNALLKEIIQMRG